MKKNVTIALIFLIFSSRIFCGDCVDSAPVLESQHPDFLKCSRHCEHDNDCLVVDQCEKEIAVSKKYLDLLVLKKNCLPRKWRCMRPICVNHLCTTSRAICTPVKKASVFSER